MNFGGNVGKMEILGRNNWIMDIIWLVVEPTPLKNMSSSVGMMTFPTGWKVIKFHGSKPSSSNYIITNYNGVHLGAACEFV